MQKITHRFRYTSAKYKYKSENKNLKKKTLNVKQKNSSFLEAKRWSKIIPSIKNIETMTTSNACSKKHMLLHLQS